MISMRAYHLYENQVAITITNRLSKPYQTKIKKEVGKTHQMHTTYHTAVNCYSRLPVFRGILAQED